MRLLLTSAGITTDEIAQKLADLVADGNTKVGFISTAADVEPGNKDWFLGQCTNLQIYGYNWIDIIDPSAPGVDWKTRLEEVGIVFVSGGNTFHLLDQMRKTGCGLWLSKYLDRVVYVGVSAGSIIATPSIGIASVDNGDENLPNLHDLQGLGFVDFEISPHTPEMVSNAGNEGYAATIKNKLYAINDASAIAIHDGKVEFLGTYREYN